MNVIFHLMMCLTHSDVVRRHIRWVQSHLALLVPMSQCIFDLCVADIKQNTNNNKLYRMQQEQCKRKIGKKRVENDVHFCGCTENLRQFLLFFLSSS